MNTSQTIPTPALQSDYANLLQELAIPFEARFPYLFVGQPSRNQGWILHISAVVYQGEELLRAVLPILQNANCSFKIPISQALHQEFLECIYGYTKVGKVITVYAHSDEDTAELATALIGATRNLRGPRVPTDAWLGGTVYTRYGAFNPILLRDERGTIQKFIANDKDEWVPDPESIPFAIPAYARWIFTEPLRRPAKDPKILNNAFLPALVIKADAKGRVVKGISIKRLFHPEWCLIKEGKMGMFSDVDGREISDRLEWQAELGRELQGKVLTPRVLDFFRQGENAYLVTEFLEGRSLGEVAKLILREKFFWQLTPDEQKTLNKYLLEVCAALERLHSSGIIHRDVTPANFMITRAGDLSLIDLELAQNFKTQTPRVAFRLGTLGYMSPEQQIGGEANPMHDVYGLGATLLTVYTNGSPIAFSLGNNERLAEDLHYFTGDGQLAGLIASCLSNDPEDRPTLSNVSQVISGLPAVQADAGTFIIAPSPVTVESAISAGLKTLGSTMMTGIEGLWFSKPQNSNAVVGNDNYEVSYDIGLHTGVLGPMMMIAKAALAGLPIDDVLPAYQAALQFVLNEQVRHFPNVPGGLFYGSAGTALTFAHGIRAGLIEKSDEHIRTLERCFEPQLSTGDFVSGAAGTGIALLTCKNLIPPALWAHRVKSYTEMVVGDLRMANSPSGKSRRQKTQEDSFSLSTGLSGRLLYLVQSQKATGALSAADDTLTGLTALSDSMHSIFNPAKNNKKRTGLISRWLYDGVLGPALTLVHASPFEGGKALRETADMVLDSFTIPFNPHNCGSGYGLAGLGEVLLDAHHLLGDAQYLDRCGWITQHLVHVSRSVPGGKLCWLLDDQPQPYADLATGNAGVLHYLIRYYSAINNRHLPLF